jgi:hypothetical protein
MKIMFDNILSFIRGNPFSITLGMVLMLVLTTRLSKKNNKSMRIKQRPKVGQKSIITDVGKYLSEAYGSPSNEIPSNEIPSNEIQKGVSTQVVTASAANIQNDADKEQEEYYEALENLKKINKTPPKQRNTPRSVSRSRKRIGL